MNLRTFEWKASLSLLTVSPRKGLCLIDYGNSDSWFWASKWAKLNKSRQTRQIIVCKFSFSSLRCLFRLSCFSHVNKCCKNSPRQRGNVNCELFKREVNCHSSRMFDAIRSNQLTYEDESCRICWQLIKQTSLSVNLIRETSCLAKSTAEIWAYPLHQLLTGNRECQVSNLIICAWGDYHQSLLITRL